MAGCEVKFLADNIIIGNTQLGISMHRLLPCFIFFISLAVTVCGQHTSQSVTASSLKNLIIVAPDSAYAQLKLALKTAVENEDDYAEAVCHQQMGEVLFHIGQYQSAFQHLLLAQRYFAKGNFIIELAQTLSLLGNTYYYNQQKEEAFNSFNEAFKLFSKLNDKEGMALSLSEIGRIFEKKQQYAEAEAFQRRAFGLALNTTNLNLLASVYENLASIKEDLEVFDSAFYYYQQSLQGYIATNNKVAQIEVINNLGDIYRKTNRIPEGMNLTRKAMMLANELQEKYQLNSAYRDLAKSFQLLNKYDSAYYYLELSRDLVAALYASENSKQIAMMQTLFDTERKNAAIAELTAGRKVTIAWTIAAIVVLVLLALLAIVIFSRQKLKINTQKDISNQAQQVYEAQKELMEAAMRNKQLEEAQLKQQLEVKSNELSSHLLHLIQKNEVLESLKVGINELLKEDSRSQKKQLKQLLQKINFSFSQDQYWEEFRLIFDQVHHSFFAKIQEKCGELSSTEMRLLALVKMNLSSNEIATLLGITPDSLRVTRYRVKKKLNLGPEESLSGFIQAID